MPPGSPGVGQRLGGCHLQGHLEGAAAAAGRHCMVGEESEVCSPLPHKEVVNSLAKTLEQGGTEEKLAVASILTKRTLNLLLSPPTSEAVAAMG